jgi:hypothetical protein
LAFFEFKFPLLYKAWKKGFIIFNITKKAEHMMKLIAVSVPGPRARFTGFIYLLFFLTAVLAEILHGRGLVGYSHAANLISYLCYLIVTLLFFWMFKPVNLLLSLAAALFSLSGCIVGVTSLFGPAPLNISPLLFYGPYCILIGWLIIRSAFLPHILGWVMLIAGLGWLIFLLPSASFLSIYIEVLGILAEASLMLWLIVAGVDVRRWKEQTEAKKH